MERQDHIANILSEALDRVIGNAGAKVLHPKDDVEPHVDVYVYPPTELRRSWLLLTAGLSWWMAKRRKAGESLQYPVELLCRLPPSVGQNDAIGVGRAMSGIALYPVKHGAELRPGTLIPTREAILPGTDLRAFFFGPSDHPMASALRHELPTRPEILETALLTSAERRVASFVDAWDLWKSALPGDLGRVRCVAPLADDASQRSDAFWGFAELRAAAELPADREADAAIALREGLQLRSTCGGDEPLVITANMLLWAGKRFASSNPALAAQCFDDAARMAGLTGAPRAAVLADVAARARKGDFAALRSSRGGDQLLLTAERQDARLAWLRLSRDVTADPAHCPPSDIAPIAERYQPGAPLDFVVDVALPRPMRRSELLGVFSQPWFVRHAFPKLQGRRAQDGGWSGLGTPAMDAPDVTCDAARIVARVFDPRADGDRRRRTVEELREMVLSMSSGGAGLIAVPQCAPEEIIAGIDAINRIVDEHDNDLRASLVFRRPVDGRLLWDAAHACGLRWGDGDGLHSSANGRRLFSVFTSTEPGYFIPEQIFSGIAYADLEFGFHLPTALEPERVLGAMLGAMKQVQAKLGGELRSVEGDPLDEAVTVTQCRDRADQMRAAGWPPGDPRTRELLG